MTNPRILIIGEDGYVSRLLRTDLPKTFKVDHVSMRNLSLEIFKSFASGMEVVDVNLPLIQQLFDYHIIINCSGQVNHVPASPEDQSVIRQHLFFPLLLIKVLQLSTSLKLFLTLGSCDEYGY